MANRASQTESNECHSVDVPKGSIRGRLLLLPGTALGARTEKFDIDAKAEKPVQKGDLMAMLRSLLADRFSLAFHPETEDLLAYALVATKKPLLEDSDPDAVSKWDHGDGPMAFKHTTMRTFVGFLNSTGTMLFHLDLPVVNLTEMEGSYDFSLSYPLSEFARHGGDALLVQAVRKLGLDLNRRKVPVKVLVVDHLERPSEN